MKASAMAAEPRRPERERRASLVSRQRVEHHEAHIVPRALVLRARVAEADDHERIAALASRGGARRRRHRRQATARCCG